MSSASPPEEFLMYVGRPPAEMRACALDAKFVGEDRRMEKYVRRRVRYRSGPDEWIPAYLLIPHDLPARSPAVVALHQHATQFHLGKSEVVGLAGNPQQAYAHELADLGYVVLAADAPAFEERTISGMTGLDGQAEWAARERARGFTLGGHGIWDIGRGIDFLQTLPFVDPDRIGVIGHSMGGWMTVFAMAIEPRLKVGVANCGFQHLNAQGPYFGLKTDDSMKLGRDRIVGEMICPRPLLIISTTLDQDPDAVRRDVDAARNGYAAAGHPERLELWVPDGRHRFLDDVRPRAYEWLGRWL